MVLGSESESEIGHEDDSVGVGFGGSARACLCNQLYSGRRMAAKQLGEIMRCRWRVGKTFFETKGRWKMGRDFD